MKEKTVGGIIAVVIMAILASYVWSIAFDYTPLQCALITFSKSQLFGVVRAIFVFGGVLYALAAILNKNVFGFLGAIIAMGFVLFLTDLVFSLGVNCG